ncbi:[pyruvate dehydrogenase (acetyl-transferring)] kinase [Malassezia vespertilionis]|uniref:Bur1p n=1 Tax=Malassezia vespertilionis TaxID=2020962 RepID=A0A2N1J967_9BASI|nr:[pyruvate dehydrogenase (acetyl-transferring)] kinase [Malassezia vespertilionis]PKI83098.1 Bur1p [Malassezia vespertilionis]WFD07533.1 [pyruvate dehydrogenase (acetyl-transferring)] kinase [Malassezia vespertilionis]
MARDDPHWRPSARGYRRDDRSPARGGYQGYRARSRSPPRGEGHRTFLRRSPSRSPRARRRPSSPYSRSGERRNDDRGMRSWDYDERSNDGWPRNRDHVYERPRPRPAPYHLDEPQETRVRPLAYTDSPTVREPRRMPPRPDSRGDTGPPRRTSRPESFQPPEPEPEPVRPKLNVPIKVRKGPRPGTLARRNRVKPAPLKERRFVGCSTLDQYDLTVKLGQGTFGEVKQGKQVTTGRDVALKKVTIYEARDGMPITALREIKLLKALHHPHIVPVIDMAYKPATERGKMGDVYMVEPYMDHDLNGLLDNPDIHLQMNQIKLYMRELLEGTLHMHKNHILHRDMKAANLLIDNEGQLQIADFGLARPFHDPTQAWRGRGWKGSSQNYTDMVVTRWYRPPELLAGQRNYGPPVDMWGVGCILAEMVTGKPIFKGASEINQLELIAALCGSPNEDNFPGWSKLPGVKNATSSGRPDTNPNTVGRHDFGRHPRIVKQHFTSTVDVGRECADLIDRLLTLDPRKRLTAAEALEHEWFWTKPYPADPASLPKYTPSKEIDRNKRDRKVPRQANPAPLPLQPPLPLPPQQAVGSAAYPAMPRIPIASKPRSYDRPNDQGWYNPSHGTRDSRGPSKHY